MSSQQSSNPSPGQPQGSPEMLSVEFEKDGHRYTFRFTPGQERAVFEALVALAQDPECNLDWFDAAMLSHRMAPHLQNNLQPFAS